MTIIKETYLRKSTNVVDVVVGASVVVVFGFTVVVVVVFGSRVVDL